MATIKPYPHYRINVIDQSIGTVNTTAVLPIHRPVYVTKTQEGPAGIPVWCESFTKASRIFGAQTFNEGNPTYFSQQAFFLKNTMTYNGAFIVRAAASSAKQAIGILEAIVTPASGESGIVQYEKDESGNRIVDAEGEYVPLLDVDSNPVKEDGITISYRVRYAKTAEEADLQLNELTIRTLEGGVKVIPLFVFEALYVGNYGNDLALQIFYKSSENDASVINQTGSIFTTLAPSRRDYNKSTFTAYRDIYGNVDQSFCIKPDVVDPVTGISKSMDVVLSRAYSEDNQLPYTIYTYVNNINQLGNMIIDVETNDDVLGFVKGDDFDAATSELGFRVNIYSLRNPNNQLYDHVVFEESTDTDVVKFTSGYNIFLGAGEDGSLSDVTVEDAVQSFCKGTLYPEIEDSAKYPITHMYDVGFSAATKFAMLDFLNLREDIGVEVTPQVLFADGTGTPIKMNTQMEDETLGEVLRSYALLMRESIAKGTECCRASIYMQSGFPIAPTYNKPVPFTFWSAMKHAEYHNVPYLSSREPRGWPYSYNTLFKGEPNWVPYSHASRSRLWDNGFNYCISADMSRIFYPALRTVYRYESSALVDQWFVDAIIYAKHTIRQAWGNFTGRNDYTDVIQSEIEKYLVAELGALFGGRYRFSVRVYQTAIEQQLGYIQHVAINITAPNTNRGWDVDIIVGREGLDSEAGV